MKTYEVEYLNDLGLVQSVENFTDWNKLKSEVKQALDEKFCNSVTIYKIK